MTVVSTETQQINDSSARVGEVGRLLRQAREKSGQDLRSIADQLKIRHVHLLAIEEGRYQDLPGATYAVGFVRAYAELMSLDGAEIVRRFKDESTLETQTKELAFPAPANEGGIPSGAVLAIALLLGGVVYGVWSATSSMERSFVDMIQDVPDRLVAMVQGGDTANPAAEAPAVADPAPVAERLIEAATPDEEKANDKQATDVTPPNDEEGEKASDTGKATTTPANTVKSEPIKAEPAKSEPAKTEVAKTEQTKTGQTKTEPAKTEPAKPEPAKTEPAKPEPVKPEPMKLEAVKVDPAKPEGSVPHGNSRVMIVAKQEAWINVRDQGGSVVSRRMMAGETYEVPARPGLYLNAGNAGGTVLVVDGVTLPPLGATGQVLRNIALDPDKLKASTR